MSALTLIPPKSGARQPGARSRAAGAVAATLLICAAFALGEPTANAAGLDPFRPSHAPSDASPRAWDPFATTAKPVRRVDVAQAAPAAAPSAPTPTPPATAPAPLVSCASDLECPDETICEQSQCRRVERRVNVFYLYYQDGTFREILGLYWSKRGNNGYTVGFPLYWNYFAPKSRSRIVAPFYWHFEDDTAKTSTTVIVPGLPVSWTRSPDAHSFAVWPLFYASSKFGWAAPLLLSFRLGDPDQGRSFGTLALLYWWHRTPKSSFDLGIPVFFSKRSPDSAFTYAIPLNFYWRTGPSWFSTGFPLWWSAGNAETDWRFQMLVPFFFWKRGEHNRSFTLITPLGGYSRDSDDKSHTTTIWPLLTFFRRDPVRDVDIVTPLFIRHRNHAADANTRLLGLLLYLRDDPAGSTSVLFPFVWRFEDAATQSTGTVVFPFGYHRSGPQGSATYGGLFPVWFFHRELADGGWSSGVFPLAFFGKKGDASHQVVFPLFWRFADNKGTTTALLPLFWSTSDKTSRQTAILPALTFWGSNDTDGRSYQIQFPLFWRFADARTQTSTAVTPVGFYGTSPNGWRLGVGPLLPIVWAAGGGPQRHFVVFPIFWHFADDRADESSTLATLFFHRRRGGETTDALFPLIYYRRGARVPGDDQTSLTLPLFHYHRDSVRRYWVTPIAASAEGPTRAGGFVGPYLWYRGANFQAQGVPLLFADIFRKDTQEHTRQIGPYVAIDAPGRQTRVLLPLWGHYEDRNETDTFVFPSYFHRRTTDGYALDTFLPLYWHSDWKDHSATVVGPWYSREAPMVHNTGLAPLYFWAKNADRTMLVIPPLLTVHRHDFRAGSSFTWAGPFFQSNSADADRTVVFPLWWSGQSRGRTNPGSYQVLAPLYWHFEDHTAKTEWTLLPLFYASRHGAERTRALLPIAWYTRNDEDKSGSEAILPLFYTAHGPNRFALLTLLGGVSRGPTTSRWYAGPLYFSDTASGSTRALFPIYFSHFDRSTETTTRVFLPLLHYGQSRPGKSFMTWAALFWRSANVTSATTAVVPLFYDVHHYDTSRTTTFIPLFVRHNNEVTKETYWFAPFFYSHTGPRISTHVLFPLIWDLKRDDRRTTIVLPLYAHWTRPTHSGTYVFPNIYYRKGFVPGGVAGTPREPDGTWRLLIPPLFEAAVQRPGDFRWEVLGGLFGKERIGRNHYLKLFFFSIATKNASPAQTAWYGQPQRPSRTRPLRGLATNSW